MSESKFERALKAFRKRVFARVTRGAMPVTRAVCLSMVKNEQDVIEPFLRHNSPYFDAMIVLDNRSADRTREIATELARELGNVFVSDMRQTAYDQARFMTQAAHFVQSSFFADFVFFLDADEFLIAPPVEEFHSIIRQVPVGSCLSMDWETRLPDPELSAQAGCDPLKAMVWARDVENPPYRKVALRLHGGVDTRIALLQGYHSAYGPIGKTMKTVEVPGCKLAHFPLRSAQQAVTKGVVGWRANLARAKAHQSEAYQWKRLHDIYHDRRAAALSGAELAQEALIYSQLPPHPVWPANTKPASGIITAERRYSDGSYGSPDTLIKQSETLPKLWPCRIALAGTAGPAPALKKALSVDVAPFISLLERHEPQTVMQYNCGSGEYLDIARQVGATKVFGIDSVDHAATSLAADEYCQLDPRKQAPAVGTFDLVIYLERNGKPGTAGCEQTMTWVAEIAKNKIIFAHEELRTSSRTRARGRVMQTNLAKWAARGWYADVTETLGFRALSTLHSFRRTAVILTRTKPASERGGAELLTRIDGFRYVPNSQPAGVREAAFEETYPTLRYGYGLRRS